MKEITLPARLIRMFENDPVVGWGVKDNQSHFVYVNNTFKSWQTLSTKFDYEGRHIRDMPVPVAEFADLFSQQERDRKNWPGGKSDYHTYTGQRENHAARIQRSGATI